MVNPNTRLQAYSIPSSALALHFARKATHRPGTCLPLCAGCVARLTMAQKIRAAIKATVRGMGGH